MRLISPLTNLFFLLLLSFSALVASNEVPKKISTLSKTQISYLNTLDELTFCIDPVWMPFEAIENKKINGMTSDFIPLMENYFKAYLKKPMRLVITTSWNQSLQYLANGKCLFLPMISVTPENSKSVAFTSAYMKYTGAIIARDDFPFISNIQDLKNYKLAMIKASSWWEYAQEKLDSSTFVNLPTIKDGLLSVSAGQADALLTALPVATSSIRQLGLTNLKVAGHTEVGRELSVGVNINNPELLSILNTYLLSLPQEKIDSIYNKWQGVRFEHGTDYLLVWQMLGLMCLILFFLGYRYKVMSSFNHRLVSLTTELENTNQELTHLATTDVLTQLYNRRYFMQKMLEIHASCVRYQQTYSIILLDIDHFKRINDNFGHSVGDLVIQQISNILKSTSRETDIVARWGGEEFIILCTNTNLKNAKIVAEKIRQQIEQFDFSNPKQVTVSLGLSEFQTGQSIDSLIDEADQHLYLAKKLGRNLVCDSQLST